MPQIFWADPWLTRHTWPRKVTSGKGLASLYPFTLFTMTYFLMFPAVLISIHFIDSHRNILSNLLNLGRSEYLKNASKVPFTFLESLSQKCSRQECKYVSINGESIRWATTFCITNFHINYENKFLSFDIHSEFSLYFQGKHFGLKMANSASPTFFISS